MEERPGERPVPALHGLDETRVRDHARRRPLTDAVNQHGERVRGLAGKGQSERSTVACLRRPDFLRTGDGRQ